MTMVPMNRSSGKRILLPLLRKYYLFDYFKHLACHLQKEGFSVRVVTFDDEVEAEYTSLHSGLLVQQGPRFIRFLNNRSGNIFMRVLLWLAAWGWALWLRRDVDMVIVPFDQKPIWYAMTRSMPSMTCHTSTDMVDAAVSAGHYAISDSARSRLSHRGMVLLDRLTGGRILLRATGHIIAYEPMLLLVDRIMGYRAPSSFHGVSGASYLTVEGAQVRKNFMQLGIGASGHRTRIAVVGSPAYELVFRIAASFDESARDDFRRERGIPAERPMFSLFLSPSKFSEVQVDEIATVISTIRRHVPTAFIMIKFHPKTRPGEPERIRSRTGLGKSDLLTVTEFGGDELNTRLVLTSYCLVQKQSTVGFIAMLLKVPIISYNLRDTGYSDDLYKSLKASFHVEDEEALGMAIQKLKTEAGRAELSNMQDAACEDFCIRTASPCRLIVDVLKDHFFREVTAIQ